MIDIPEKLAEVEAEIHALTQRYREVQQFMQQTADRVIYLQGQFALLTEIQKPAGTSPPPTSDMQH